MSIIATDLATGRPFILQSGDVVSAVVASSAFPGVFPPVELDGHTIDDLAWSYPEPLPAAAPVAGLICFFDERVDVSLDGHPQPRPLTPWS